MAIHQGAGSLEVPFPVAGLADRAFPERALVDGGGGDGLDDGERQLALPEIVPDVLAGGARVALPVEQIVGDLEGDAERVAVGSERLDIRLGGTCDEAADLGRGGEEGRGLAADRLRAAVSCMTSPSAMVAAASERISRTRSEPVAVISWKERAKR